MTDDAIDFVLKGIGDEQCSLYFFLEMEVSQRINQAIRVLKIPKQEEKQFREKVRKNFLLKGLNALLKS